MILETLQVVSFGALVSLKLELEPGANVILGPNEAGKSTLFKALQHLLLTSVNLNKRNFQEVIQPLLPVGGGDTVSASIRFRVEDRPYHLEKSWGASSAVELRLPDGARITEEEAVDARLRDLLPVSPGTLRTVLLTFQSGLSTTMEELKENKETVYSLSDLLHRSVLETDGISVGRFRELLDQRCSQYLKHWDLEPQSPERKRGADTRWSRERGTVLEAYYTLEDSEKHYEEVKETEVVFGKLTEQLEACTRELAEKEGNLKGIEKAAKDAEERRVLEVKLENTELSLKDVQSDYQSWTKGLLRREGLEKELPELQQSVQALEPEKDRVQAYQQKQGLIEHFKRIRAKREQWQQAEARLSELLPLSRSQLEQLQHSASEIERLKASLKAGNLSLTFRAHKAIDLVTGKDMEPPAEQHLAKDKPLTIEAAGKIEMHHREWSLEVYSGKGEFKEIADQYDQAQSRLQQLLDELKVSSIQEAETASQSYEAQRSDTQTVRTVYEQELGSDSFEALEETYHNSSELPPSRELSQVIEELVRKQSRAQDIQTELENIQKKFDTMSTRYGDKETLFARIVELAGAGKELNEKLSRLDPLPKGYTDARSLIDYYNGLKEDVEASRREKIRLESDCRNAENSLPDESSEEAKRRRDGAREQFHRQVQKAEILVRVKEAAGGLLEELDEGVYEPFTALVSQYLATLTNNRYRNVPSGTSLPGAVVRRDGRNLPYDLLSAGTKDIFALAMRLAMAEFFLGGTEGFLILDDPLVDLDPDRQRRAAALLTEFSKKQQLVIFTCHPTHAQLLAGAHRVEIGTS
ncbi:MAG: AAA family ATPase [Spirochaetia bacterium]